MKKLLLFLLLFLLAACVPLPEADNHPVETATSLPIKTVAPVSPTPPQTAAVCADWLNVRQQAGVAHPVVASLERGQTIPIQSTTRTADGATWARTDSGWVNTKYLCKENP